MSIMDSTLSFIEGIKSTLDFNIVIQNAISRIFSKSIEEGYLKIKKSIEDTIIKILLIVISCFLIIWGISIFLDNFLPYDGLGFILVGTTFGIIVFILLNKRK
jgi:hypothetical protein